MLKKWIIFLSLAFGILGFTTFADAVPLKILDIPGPQYHGFNSNLLHAFEYTFGGRHLARMRLDHSMVNVYDPDTGDISFSVDLYNDFNATNFIGKATVIGFLPAGNFVNDGGFGGTLTWNFDISDSSSFLYEYLIDEGIDPNTTPMTLTFADEDFSYANGIPVNSYDRKKGILALWGGDGFVDRASYPSRFHYYDLTQSILGADLIIQTQVIPEPLTVSLFSSGMLGMMAFRRRMGMNKKT